MAERGRIVSAGYNGAPSGLPHCTEVGCLMATVRERERCTRIIHAEDNALKQAHGRGDTLYTTGKPCYDCLKDIITTNISCVVWWQDYDDPYRETLLKQVSNRLTLVHLDLRPVFQEILNEPSWFVHFDERSILGGYP